MCVQKDCKTAQAARCIKLRVITKVIDYVFYIDTFEPKCAVIKGMLQSLGLKYHVQTIGFYQSLINNALYEHKCLENIKKLYKQAGNFDDQQKFKDILGGAMVSTPEGLTNDSPISPMTSTLVKKPYAQKSLCLFTNILDVKKTATCKVGAAKYERKAIKYINTPWELKQKRKGNSKID